LDGLHRSHGDATERLGRAQVSVFVVRAFAKMRGPDLPKAFPDPLKALGILRGDISSLFLQPTRAQESACMFNPREVILSSYLVNAETSRSAIHQI
jgi:hypothetical protein